MVRGLSINDTFPNLIGFTQANGNFSLYDYIGEDSWACIFMHPGDFTPVCTTELGAAALLAPQFEERNVKLCGFSCNDSRSHQEWIEDIEVVTGGLVEFPMFCDPDRQHAVDLGILDVTNKDSMGMPLTVRAVYILKPNKTIALTMMYPASTGRNFDEILRVIDSLQLTSTAKLATPVNWRKGDEAIVNYPLSDKEADKVFGKDGYRILTVPSEEGKELSKHYMRYAPTTGIFNLIDDHGESQSTFTDYTLKELEEIEHKSCTSGSSGDIARIKLPKYVSR